jgi:Protein of unknown function (DUF1592)/Protein of unknown function (DUF1588)/Protein of unknown function (DUF1595)/Protein of unknown function (DUF1587)/Protein of unknown function (DUF1585)
MRRLLSLAAPAALLLAVGCKGQISGDSSGGGGSGSGTTTGTGANTGGGSISGTGNSGSGNAVGGGSSSGQGGSTGSGNSSGTGGGTALALASSLAAPSPCTSNAPGPRKLWRLTAAEFTNSIRSIFNDTSNDAPIVTVFSDPTVLGFSVDSNGLLVQGLNASQLEDNAEAIADWAATSGKLATFASCASSTSGAPQQSCATSFIQAFGKVAFRTTLASNDARIAKYTSLFMAGSSNQDGAEAVVSGMLQSPYFLYRSELGTQSGSSYKLTPYEVATELAYTLTGTTPDSMLLQAADSVNQGGSLSSMIDQQASRLIQNGSATNSTAVMGFMDGWLGLSRLYTTAHDATVYQLSSALQKDMWNESQNLIMEAFNNNGTFGSVLTADHSFLNQELASFYGISTNLGTSFTSVKYAGLTTRDPGLLGTGTILNGYARPDTDSPTQRGHLIRSRLLCQDIPMPMAGLNTTFMPSSTPETTRDHFINEHEANTVCAGCHKPMDWIGFAFENYDGWGRYRTTDNGFPTDDTAIIYGDPEGNDVHLTGLSGSNSLGDYLAKSDDVTKCLQRYWTYYTYGSSTWSQDACTYTSIYNEAKTNGSSLKSTLMAILHAANFTTRVKDQ